MPTPRKSVPQEHAKGSEAQPTEKPRASANQAEKREHLLLTCTPIMSRYSMECLAAALRGMMLVDAQGCYQQVVTLRIDGRARKIYGQLQEMYEAAPYMFAPVPDADRSEDQATALDGAQDGHGLTTVGMAGRKGGRKVAEKYGPEHFRQIGERGGRALLEQQGLEFYSEIGRKGGNTNKEERGSDFFSQIGKRGGAALRDKRGLEFFSQIGKKGGATPKRPRRRKNRLEPTPGASDVHL